MKTKKQSKKKDRREYIVAMAPTQDPRNERRLMLAFPSREDVSVGFMTCFVDMFKHLMITPAKGVNLTSIAYSNHRGSILPQLRQGILDEAIKGDFTHLLMIDSDQTFPPDLATYWLELNLPVIAANIAIKKSPSNSTARAKTPNGPIAIRTTKEKHLAKQLQQIWRIGTGIMMIDLRAIRHIPKPHFPIRWNEENQNYVGEDWSFCEILEAHDIPIVIDHYMSYKVGHIGPFEYGHAMIEMQDKVSRVRAHAKGELPVIPIEE